VPLDLANAVGASEGAQLTGPSVSQTGPIRQAEDVTRAPTGDELWSGIRIFNGSMPSCARQNPHWLAAPVEFGPKSSDSDSRSTAEDTTAAPTARIATSAATAAVPLRRYLDMGREIQGGVALSMTNGVKGHRLTFGSPRHCS
jgi:hypothetical protein